MKVLIQRFVPLNYSIKISEKDKKGEEAADSLGVMKVWKGRTKPLDLD